MQDADKQKKRRSDLHRKLDAVLRRSLPGVQDAVAFVIEGAYEVLLKNGRRTKGKRSTR